MTDDQFRALCNTYGFAPSRALREMLDAAMREERVEILQMLRDKWFKTQNDIETFIGARGQA